MIPRSRFGRAARILGAAVGPAVPSVSTLGRLNGGAHKLGQTLALFADGMPPELKAQLGLLFSEAEARPWAEMERAIGGLPAGLLASVEPVPLAAASMAQVHAARLANGDEVVVKLLYPGIAQALHADLDNLGTLALPAKLVEGGARMLVGLRESLLAELDLRVEAEALREMAAAVKPWPRLGVPEVFAATADAHPGNLLLGPSGLGLADLGALAAVPRVGSLAAGLDRALQGDTEGVLAELGVDAGRLTHEFAFVLGPLQSGLWDFSNDRLLDKMGELKRRHPFAVSKVPFSSDRLPLIRAVMGLHYCLRRLGLPFGLGESLRRVRERATEGKVAG